VLTQFLRFLLVGGTATLIHYAVLVALHSGASVPAVEASALGFVLSAVFNFFASYRYTFRSTASVRRSAVTYATVSMLGLLLNSIILAAVTSILAWHYLVGQVLATGVVLAWNFLLGRYVTFAAARVSKRV
jgi:putative flippase GtrA